MKRRQFLATAGAVSLGSLSGCGPERAAFNASDTNLGTDHIETLGGMTLEQHRQRYRVDLFDRYIPHMDAYVIDHDLGGFMCAVDIRTGEQISSEKRAWYEGRGMWSYAFLYNNLERNPYYLEVARRTKDFILPRKPEGREFYPTSFSKEGERVTGPGDIYGNLFVAEGLAEYAIASGELEYYEEARRMILDCFDRYNDPGYGYRSESLGIPTNRVLGHSMIFLRLVSQMLEHQADPALEEIADHSLESILERHMNPEYQLCNEYLTHDYTLPDNDYADFCATGHSIESFWMVMFEAARRGDQQVFEDGRNAFKRHVTVAQDAVYGGYFHELTHVTNYDWNVSKVLWLQEEILIGTLFLIEHTGDPWARRVFAETDAHIREKHFHPDYRFWTSAGDRTLSVHNTTRAENYHHPRHLMLNLMAIERMIEREGRITGRFG